MALAVQNSRFTTCRPTSVLLNAATASYGLLRIATAYMCLETVLGKSTKATLAKLTTNKTTNSFYQNMLMLCTKLIRSVQHKVVSW